MTGPPPEAVSRPVDPPARAVTGRAFRIPILATLATAALLAILVALDLDISARGDLFTDLTLRQEAGGSRGRYRFVDPSPFSIWVPSDLFVRSAIRQGELPLWNRHQGGGYSPLLTFQNGVMHPLRWVTAALPAGHAPNFLVLAPLLAGFAGMFLYLRRGLALSEAAAVYGSSVFLFCGNTMSVALFSGALLPLVHLPWILLAFRGWCARAEGYRFAVLTLLIASLLISGHPAYIFVVAIIVALTVVGEMVSGTARLRDFASIAAASIAALAVSAVAWVPPAITFESFWSYKTSSAEGLVYGFHSWGKWLELLQYSLFDSWMAPEPFDGADYFAFLGFWAIGVALVGAALAWRDRRLRFSLWMLPVTFLLAFPPPFLGPLANVPPLVWLKPWYLFAGFAFAVALAGSVSADALARRSSFRMSRVLLAALLISPLLAYGVRTVALFVPVPVQKIDSRLMRFLREHVGGGRVTGMRGHAHLPNSGTLTGIDDLRVVSPLISARYRTWFGLADPAGLSASYPTLPTNADPSAAFLGDFNTALLLQSRLPSVHMYSAFPDQKIDKHWIIPNAPSDPGFRLIHRTGGLNVWENRENRPGCCEIVGGPVRYVRGPDQAAAWLRSHGPGAATVVEGNTGPLAEAPAGPAERVSVRHPRSGEVVLEVQTTGRRLVILRELWSEGWTAAIDGQRTEIFPVNLVSRGIVVPPGSHRVVMEYHPPGFAAGATTSLMALFGVLAIGGRSVLRGWRRSGHE